MADALFRVSVRGAGHAASRFTRAQREVQDALIAEIRELDYELIDVFERHAPMDTGNLRDALRTTIYYKADRPRLTLRATPRDPESGFNYLNVTRFGHRKAIIRPVRARALAVHHDGRDSAPTMRQSVRGYKPSGDWVEDARREAEAHVELTTARLGRRIEARVLR